MDSHTATQAPITQPFLGAFELFRPSIKAIVLNIKTFLILFVAPFVLLLAALPLGFLAEAVEVGVLEAAFNILSGLVGIAGFAALFMVGPSLFLTQINSVRGHVVQPMPMFRQGLTFFWRFYGVTILQTLAFVLGFILLIVPGLFAMQRFVLAQYVLLDQKTGVIEAFKISSSYAKRYSNPVWGVVGVIVLMNVAAFMPFLALFSGIASILYTLAPAVRYNEIMAAEKAANKEAKSAVA